MPEDGPDEAVPLESDDGGPDQTWLDIRFASVLRFFSPGDRPSVDGDSGPGVGEPVDATRRPEVGDPNPKVGRERLIVDALAAVPYMLRERGLELLNTVLALRMRFGAFVDSSSSSAGGSNVRPDSPGMGWTS